MRAEQADTVTPGTVDAFDLLRRWSEFMAVAGLAVSTRRAYRRAVVSFWADTLLDPRSVAEDDVVAYLATMGSRGPARGLVLRALRHFYAWAEDREISLNPTRRLRVRKPKAGPAPALERAELEALLGAAERIDPRARPTIELLYATGARIGSLCAVTAEDVRGGRILFRVAKGDSPYAVPLGARAEQAVATLLALEDYVPPRGGRRRPTLVGVGPSQVWSWCQRAGAAVDLRVWPHLLRHTFATQLIRDGTDPRTWQELMNHQDLSQFRRYVAVSDAALKQAVGRL